MRVLFAVLGLPMGDEATVREKAVLMVQSDPGDPQIKGPEHIAAYEWMQAYAARIIALRRAEPCGDLISLLSSAEIDGDRLERRSALTITTLIMAGWNRSPGSW